MKDENKSPIDSALFHIGLCVCVLGCFECVQLSVTLWTVACQSPLSMGFSRQEYWNRLSCPPSGDLPNPGIEPTSLMSPALAGWFFTTSITWEVSTEHFKTLNIAELFSTMPQFDSIFYFVILIQERPLWLSW